MRLILVQEGSALTSLFKSHTQLWKHWEKVIAYLFLLVSTDQDPDPDPGHILRHTQGGVVVETRLTKLASPKSSISQSLEAQEMWQVQNLEDIPHHVHHHLRLIY